MCDAVFLYCMMVVFLNIRDDPILWRYVVGKTGSGRRLGSGSGVAVSRRLEGKK